MALAIFDHAGDRFHDGGARTSAIASEKLAQASERLEKMVDQCRV